MLINFIFILSNKTTIEFFKTLRIVIPTIMITVGFNLIFDNWNSGIIIGSRMLDCYMLTFVFSKLSTIANISKGIKNLFFPLKIFGIDIEKIEIIISVALCMIPCLINELKELKKVLKLKGMNNDLRNYILITKIQMFLMLKKIDLIEKSMILKGYHEE